MNRKGLAVGFMLLLIGTSVIPITAKNISTNTSVQNRLLTNRAGTWNEMQKMLAIDGAANNEFGYSVSLAGDTALIGAYQDADYGNLSGSAYVFTRNSTTWIQQAKLLASDGEIDDMFGYSVSLSGDTALIGAIGDDVHRGSAYVFTRTGTTWAQQAKLLASDGASADNFGYSVSLDGYTALIGAALDYDNGDHSGSAYVFTRNGTTWTQQAKLLASDGYAWDYFGYSVSLAGDTALIGAPFHDNGVDSGSTYMFTRMGSAWMQQAKLHASDGVDYSLFGCSVSLSDDTALIGASNTAYVFTHTGTTWTKQAKLLASDGTGGDYFGWSVSLDDDTALIGAYRDDDNGVDSGSAYVFTKNQPPNPPTITGPVEGKIKVATEYNFTTTDPGDDEVSYFIDWGDNTNSSWIGPYASGDAIIQSHTWTTKGTYTIKAKAKDIYGNESGWGTLSVTIPCSYSIPFLPFWERLFERFPHAFPILRQLVGY